MYEFSFNSYYIHQIWRYNWTRCLWTWIFCSDFNLRLHRKYFTKYNGELINDNIDRIWIPSNFDSKCTMRIDGCHFVFIWFHCFCETLCCVCSRWSFIICIENKSLSIYLVLHGIMALPNMFPLIQRITWTIFKMIQLSSKIVFGYHW